MAANSSCYSRARYYFNSFKDLQDLLDSSTQGVIYFSMGSVLKSSALPAATKKALLKTLGELPYTVLWKFEEELKGLPKNVHIRPWMPQPAILGKDFNHQPFWN